MRRVPTPLLLLAALALGAAPAARAGSAETIAPSFTIKGLDGRVIRLSDYRGRPVVIDFWATWCKPCKASMPHLSAIQERYSERGLVVLGLSIDDGQPKLVRRFADELGVKFRIGMADDRVLEAYGPIRMIPTTFFVNRRGDVVRRVVGYIDPETMDSYVKELF